MSKYSYLSFSAIAALSDNHEKVVSPLGELSSKTRAYSKDPGFYRSDDHIPTLINFYGVKDDVAEIMPDETKNKQLDIAQWLYQQAVAGVLTNDSTACLQLVQAQFTAGVVFSGVGTMVTNSVIYLPSHIEGTQTLTNGDTVYFKIWFANAYFEAEYPYCEIVPILVLPDDEIDKLVTLNYQQLATRLAQETPSVIEQRVLAATNDGEYRYSSRFVYPFKVYDLVNTANYNTVYFTVLVYGNADDQEDQIYTEIANAILALTSESEEDWENAIPDLFNPTQFVAIPYWDELGLENKTDGSSLYSPIASYEALLTNPTKYLIGFTSDNIIKSAQVVPFLYKSAKVCFAGKPTNFNGVTKIKELYPDYQLIPSTDSQFAWMSTATTDFITAMQTLISGAEVLTEDGLVPAGIKRLIKDNILFATIQVGSTRFQMVTKAQFIKDGIITE